jgi:hypothetical protein
MDPLHKLLSYFLKTNFNNILPPTPSSSKWFFLSVSCTITLHVFPFSPMCDSCPVHLTLLDKIIIIKSASSINCKAPHYGLFQTPVILSLLLPNILLNILILPFYLSDVPSDIFSSDFLTNNFYIFIISVMRDMSRHFKPTWFDRTKQD